MLTTSCLLCLTFAVWAPDQLPALLQRDFVYMRKVQKQFLRIVNQQGETIVWNIYQEPVRSKAFRAFYDQLPAPRDRDAVQFWLRAKVPVGTPADAAQVWLLLNGFRSFHRFPRADEANVVQFSARLCSYAPFLVYDCHIKILVDQQGRVADIVVERAEQQSKWKTLLPVMP
jgi:hypothetical protein